MKAVADAGLEEAFVRALAAGCDAALLCNVSADEQVSAIESVIRAGESGRLSATRLDDAFERQERVKDRFRPRAARVAAGLDVIGCAEHQAVAREMEQWR
jgi:beta-glucosidase-like glycosyl hydrolase